MQDFPPNSRKAKATDAPREKLKPVTSAETRERKSGLGRKFKETFFAGNSKDVARYMVEDVVVPSIRDMFRDALQGGIDNLFYGDRSSGRRRPPNSPLTSHPPARVDYRSVSSPTRASQPQQRMLSRQARARHDFQDLVIPSRQEAEDVLSRLFDVLSQYGDVSVAHLYELTGVRPEHTDEKWGWTNLRGAKAVRLRQGGFLLDLPEPEALG